MVQKPAIKKKVLNRTTHNAQHHRTGFGPIRRLLGRVIFKDFHIHVPEGATPKDGPSAGIAMVTSIVSSITGIPVDKNIAMTGEVTLRGHVLPIGGLKEKLLAAHRAGIKKIIIPDDNKKDLADIPKKILDDIEINTVKSVDEVLKIALLKELKPVEWIEVETLPKTKSTDKPVAGSTH